MIRRFNLGVEDDGVYRDDLNMTVRSSVSIKDLAPPSHNMQMSLPSQTNLSR